MAATALLLISYGRDLGRTVHVIGVFNQEREHKNAKEDILCKRKMKMQEMTLKTVPAEG